MNCYVEPLEKYGDASREKKKKKKSVTDNQIIHNIVSKNLVGNIPLLNTIGQKPIVFVTTFTYWNIYVTKETYDYNKYPGQGSPS